MSRILKVVRLAILLSPLALFAACEKQPEPKPTTPPPADTAPAP